MPRPLAWAFVVSRCASPCFCDDRSWPMSVATSGTAVWAHPATAVRNGCWSTALPGLTRDRRRITVPGCPITQECGRPHGPVVVFLLEQPTAQARQVGPDRRPVAQVGLLVEIPAETPQNLVEDLHLGRGC